ncbi:MAG: hypothetical protein ABI690_11320 [Chloroflexota bacterium]
MRVRVIGRIVLFSFVMFGLLSPVSGQDSSAQDTPAYHLRELTASEYLHGVLNTVLPSDGFFCSFDINNACHLPKLLVQETMLRYDQLDVDYATLNQLYNTVVRNARWEDAAAQFWTQQMILSWLRETGKEITGVQNLYFQDFIIQFTPFDADGDGQPEWMLKVSTGVRGFAGLMVLKRNPDGTLEFIPTPLPVERPCCFAEHDIQDWNSVIPVRAEDVNQDGRDEIIAFTLASSRYDTDNHGRFYVLGLRDGAMVDLMAEPLTYTEPSSFNDSPLPAPYLTYGHAWEFSHTGNGAELIQTSKRNDNFNCATYETTHYGWDGDHFVLLSAQPTLRYDDDFYLAGCTLRKAQEAFWAGDFQNALDLYAEILAVAPVPHSQFDDFDSQRRAYVLIRSALAQATLGDMQAAKKSLDAAQQATTNQQFTPLIEALLAADDTAVHLCKQAYDYFDQQKQQGIAWLDFVNGLYIPFGGSYRPPSPALDPVKAGCDLGTLVEQVVSQKAWTMDTPPPDQINALGIEAAGKLQADLNTDGKPDWVVWIADGMDALVFLSTPGGTYRLVRAPIPMASDQVSMFVQPLPDEAGNALVVVQTGAEAQQIAFNHYYYCLNYEAVSEPPIFTMWQVKQDAIEPTLQAPLCVARWSQETLFAADGRLRVGALSSQKVYVTANYTWDAAAQKFHAPYIIVPSPPSDPVQKISYSDANWIMGGSSFLDLWGLYEPEVILKRINKWVLDHPDDAGALYERGVIHDLMGDKAGALADFVQVYEQSTDPAIGKLAGLHLGS